MNCSKIQNLLSAYMDGELPGEEQLQIRRHLSHCTCCAEEHESLQTTKRMISSLSVRQPRQDLEEMILSVLAEEEANRKRRSPVMAWWMTLPFNRRMQFAGVFAVGAMTLAAVRIVPILLAPPAKQLNSTNFARTAVPSSRSAMPVDDVILISNPSNNAPASSGARSQPYYEFPGSGQR